MSRRRRMFIIESNDALLNADMPGYAALDYTDNMEAFLKSVKARNRSADTVQFYRQNLTRVRNILEEQDISTQVNRITSDIIERHLIIYSMEELGNSYNTVSIRLRALRAFFNWLSSRNIIRHNPMDDIVISNVKTNVETYTREQLREIFRQPDLETFVGFRDYTIMTLLLETGIRLRELTDIEVDDVNFADSQIIIWGKNQTFRRVPFQKKTKTLLKRYLKIRGHSPVSYLFITQDDMKMSRKNVQDRIRKYGRMAGITNVRNSPHTFRHTFAKMAVQNGANIFELQKILGHKTLDMVRVYVNLFSRDVARAHAKFSPVENLNMPE